MRKVCLLVCILVLGFGPVNAHSPVYRCCSNEKLSIMPPQSLVAEPFLFNKDGRAAGFLAELLRLVAEETGVELAIEFVPPHPLEYVDAVHRFVLGEATGYLTSTDYRMGIYQRNFTEWGPLNAEFEQNLPHYSSVRIGFDTFGGLVHKTAASQDIWRLFHPFETELWIAILCAVAAFAVPLALLDGLAENRRWAQNSLADNLGVLATSIYHTMAAILNGDDHEVSTWPQRLFRLGLLFFVLVTSATYTANLASFFTAPAVMLHGPTSMSELRQSAALVGLEATGRAVGAFPKSLQYAYGEGGALGQMEDYNQDNTSLILAWATQQLRSGQADVYLDSRAYLRYMQAEDEVLCRNFYIPEQISLGRSDPLLLLPPDKRALASHLQVAVDWLMAQPSFVDLEQRWFGTGGCGLTARGDAGVVTLESQTGLFIISGACVGVGLLVAAVQKWKERRGGGGRGGEGCGQPVASEVEREGGETFDSGQQAEVRGVDLPRALSVQNASSVDTVVENGGGKGVWEDRRGWEHGGDVAVREVEGLMERVWALRDEQRQAETRLTAAMLRVTAGNRRTGPQGSELNGAITHAKTQGRL